MNTGSPHETADADLDREIRGLMADLESVTPSPPAFGSLRSGYSTGPSRFVPAVAAAALIVVGIGGLMALRGDDEPVDLAPSRQPETVTAPPTATEPAFEERADGSILRTELDPIVTPLIVLPGWATTYASSAEDQPIDTGGFENALVVVVGDGPMYDAPLFAAVVVPRSEESGNVDLNLSEIGDPVDVAGTTGYVASTETDVDTQLDGPIVTLFWEIDGGHYLRVNTVRVGVDETVALANQLRNDPTAGLSFDRVPDGYRRLALPDHDDRRYVEFQYELDGRSVQVNGENRGVASLLGRIAGEVRTTRVSDGLEIAYRPLPAEPRRYWVDWQLGNWSFYVSGDGFESEAQFFGVLAQLQAVDAVGFAEAADGDQFVTPVNRTATVNEIIDGIALPPDVEIDELTNLGGANTRYQEIARVTGAITCGWLDVWFDASDLEDPDGAQTAVDALTTASTWPALLEIEPQGGWAQAIWEYAGAINGGDGVITGNGPVPPSRDLAESGLGCEFD